MRITLNILLFFMLLITIGCQENKTTTTTTEAIETKSDLAKVPAAWIDNQVKKTKENLEKSEAGKIVWQAMQAHGGLDQWYNNGPVSFHFNYQPLGKGEPRNTYQTVDTWNRKARHQDAKNTSAEFGWDGEKMWTIAPDSTTFKYNLRFWAMTPYFFMGQPFALDGDGTNLELLDQKTYKDVLYNVVKVTFEAGTGDAPDDYYILYFDAKSHHLAVIRYIVSYPAYFAKGKHTPEKFMELTGEQTIDGIILPTGYRTYMLAEDEQPGEYVTEITLSEVKFSPETKSSYFDIPKGAKVSDEL